MECPTVQDQLVAAGARVYGDPHRHADNLWRQPRDVLSRKTGDKVEPLSRVSYLMAPDGAVFRNENHGLTSVEWGSRTDGTPPPLPSG